MKQQTRTAKLMLIAAMLIFGTVGLFVRLIDLPSSLIAFVRGAIGGLLLLPVLAVKNRQTEKKGPAPKKEWLLLALAGALIGLNWVLLFEAYRHMSVTVATLIYYLAPAFVILLTPFVLSEKPPKLSLILCIPALIGMVPVSGILNSGVRTDGSGLLIALGSAICYASAILINKKIVSIPTFERTVLQLFAAAAVVLPYVLVTGGLKPLFTADAKTLVLLLTLGAVHTGAAYALYFGAIPKMPPQDAALLSYLDPVIAILLSALILKEGFGWPELIGTVLILGAAIVNELFSAKAQTPAADPASGND